MRRLSPATATRPEAGNPATVLGAMSSFASPTIPGCSVPLVTKAKLRSPFVVFTNADGSKRNVSNEAGGVTFQLKGLTHVEEGTSDSPLHAIMIELKQDAPIGDDPSADLPPAFPREGAKQLLDNDRVRVWDYAFTPHRVGPLHRHVRDAVAVWAEGGKLRATPRDGVSSVNTQTKFTATYSRRGSVHTEEAIEGTPHAYVFELK